MPWPPGPWCQRSPRLEDSQGTCQGHMADGHLPSLPLGQGTSGSTLPGVFEERSRWEEA